MPLETLGRLLGLTRDPYDEPFAKAGLYRSGNGAWAGKIRGYLVRVSRSTDGMLLQVDLPVALELRPPGR